LSEGSFKSNIALVASIIIIINITSHLIDQSIKFLYYPLAVLGAYFFPIKTNLIAVLIIISLEGLRFFLIYPELQTHNSELLSHISFSSSIFLLSLLSCLLFRKERKGRYEASKALDNLKAKAEALNPFDGSDGRVVLEAISDDERFGHLVASAIELEKELLHITRLIRQSLSAYTVSLFLTEKEGALVLKAFDSKTEYILKDKKIEIGKGYVGWIGKERIPLIISEIKGGYEALGYYIKDTGVKSFIGIPLLDHGLFVGVLVADSQKESAFSKREEEILEGFGIQVIHLLKKAKVDQQIDISARGVRTLHGISSILSSTLNLKEIGEKLVELSNLIVPYDQGGVLLYDEDRGEMELLSAKNWDGIAEGSRFPTEKSLVGWIVQNRQPLLLSDLKERGEKTPIFPEINIKVRSFLGLPLDIKGERLVGVFALSSMEPGVFTTHHSHLLSIICNQAAVSIANAKLHLKMEMMAITDGLTGLLNHRRFQERFSEELRRIERHPEPLSLILADIDHFKRINDTYGHPKGDEILKRLAGILKRMVRDIDIVARYGGEEFAIILINTEREGAYRLAERIRKTIEKRPFTLKQVQERNISVTLSLGIASYPRDGKVKEDLISRADVALYRAKGEGRNRTCLYQG
jgi:diguanylate cyclase (GGDEF)-like protein